jgi:plasmid stabilization system protein ParE
VPAIAIFGIKEISMVKQVLSLQGAFVAWFSHALRQASTYDETVMSAIEALMGGTNITCVKARDDIGPDIHNLYIARHSGRECHFVVFRTGEGRIIEIFRMLHDRVDPIRHVPEINKE